MDNFRKDFPIFEKEFDKNDVVYLDSAATTLKPKSVISKVVQFYEHETSNVARGNHFLAENNTIAVESVRSKIASFIKAESTEIAFTLNCTDSINIIANSLNFDPNDEIIVSVMEHHSNYLPWLAKANIKFVDLDENGIVDLKQLESLITNKTKVIAISFVSNVTGVIQPVEDIVKIAKKRGILTLIDAAQPMSHFPVNVKKIDCDFMAFSSHKMFGPSGVGVLYAKKETHPLLKSTRLGGGVVNEVDFGKTSYKSFPYEFEGGTPNIEGILGFGAAIDYIIEKGFDEISFHLNALESYLSSELEKLDFIDLFIPSKKNHIPIFTIIPKNPKADLLYLSHMLSYSYKIIVRGGFQCCQLLYKQKKQIRGGIRISLHIYNTKEDIDRLIEGLNKLKLFFY